VLAIPQCGKLKTDYTVEWVEIKGGEGQGEGRREKGKGETGAWLVPP
jgi:hypothetical protein